MIDHEQSEANRRARLCCSKPLLKKNSSNDVSIIFVHQRKDTYSDDVKKTLQNDRLYAHPSTKKKDVAHKINVQSPMISVGEQQVIDSTPV